METEKNKTKCPDCDGSMDYWGCDLTRWDTGEHWLCYNEDYWTCNDSDCGGSISEMVGDSWHESYEDAENTV